MSLVQLQNIIKIYEDKNKVPVQALNQVNLEVEDGEFSAVAGPSGSGKTTLLNIIGGLDQPTSGSVEVAGRNLTQLNRNELADFRLQNLGFIFQAYNLIPVLTAEENAEFMLLLQGVSTEERHERVKQEFLELGIEASLLARRPNELSGGQQQRVAVARALVSNPKLILADEPTANLDSKTGSTLLDKMKEMNEKKGVTFIFSTHDPMVMERARRLISLRDGQIMDDKNNR
ncbi:ABC transporter ATP-binding protein [candidate division KSB1 bacterium]|nr:ABC transporter ATP-binding protein [candidate division KSB1 bacterium]NIR72761.1 ABC transporter ATP-binding protein [candidate division KSB1 bacterium]NIS23717.1 ABC transporter ATP-binding protein [candidate division KSB1 bacterium]NIT70637.1 ABC transporter ATP-binding protein [candidate division KSB1 bacterium]NIU24365.1 ABC transporter ATP-binding protein [candidate division KSB1 bacterium]